MPINNGKSCGPGAAGICNCSYVNCGLTSCNTSTGGCLASCPGLKVSISDTCQMTCAESDQGCGAFGCPADTRRICTNCGSGWSCACQSDPACVLPPSCTPSCSPACGQDDGCGGTCGTTDAGNPGTPTLSPADGGTVTVAEGGQVTLSWSSVAKADLYELELYPIGADCTYVAAHCLSQAGTTYSFDPLYPTYYYQVTPLNNTCSASEYGTAGSAVFNISGVVSGQVKADNNAQAVMVGGMCQLAGASGVQPGAGSIVTVNGSDTANVDGSGNYSVTTPVGAGLAAVLSVGDLTQYRCTCPLDCVYSTASPKANLDFFVSNYRPAWWQSVGGDVHANGGNISSNIPNTATNPFLIMGTTGLVSYTGSLDTGEGTINQTGEEWQAQTAYNGVRTGYGYFKRILEDDPAAVLDWNGGQPEYSADGVYTYTGNISTSGAFNVLSGEKKVILVDGDVTITDNIAVANGGFLAIIASGNILIDEAVTNVEGVYVADGAIDTGVSTGQLLAEGIFTGWGGINLTRDFASTSNNTTPVEKFTYRGDLLINAYRYLLKPHIAWQEIAP